MTSLGPAFTLVLVFMAASPSDKWMPLRDAVIRSALFENSPLRGLASRNAWPRSTLQERKCVDRYNFRLPLFSGVRDDQQCRRALERAGQRLSKRLGIESGEALVEHHQLGPLQQGASLEQTAALTVR
jgi:hypothetical protein